MNTQAETGEGEQGGGEENTAEVREATGVARHAGIWT